MKKRLLIPVICLVAALSLFCGCFEKTVTFEKAGMSITLKGNFVEKEIASQTAYYESTDAIVTAIKEEFTLVAGFSDYTLSDYTDLVLRNNKLTAEVTSRENKSYMYFTYEKTVSGKNFYYFATTHKADDAFWLIQFACVVDDKDSKTADFFEWADSIKFGIDKPAEQQ